MSSRTNVKKLRLFLKNLRRWWKHSWKTMIQHMCVSKRRTCIDCEALEHMWLSISTHIDLSLSTYLFTPISIYVYTHTYLHVDIAISISRSISLYIYLVFLSSTSHPEQSRGIVRTTTRRGGDKDQSRMTNTRTTATRISITSGRKRKQDIRLRKQQRGWR